MHLRLVVARRPRRQGAGAARVAPSALDLVHLPGVARRAAKATSSSSMSRGEDASAVISRLQELGLGERGRSRRSRSTRRSQSVRWRRERAAAGAPADAVVWEQRRGPNVRDGRAVGELPRLLILATLIAAVGIVTDSIILIIGAMSAARVRAARRTLRRARAAPPSLGVRSLTALLVGFPRSRSSSRTSARSLLRALGFFPRVDRRARGDALPPPEPLLGARRLLARRRRDGLVRGQGGRADRRARLGDDDPDAANVAVAAAYRDWGERRRGRGARIHLSRSCGGASLRSCRAAHPIVVSAAAELEAAPRPAAVAATTRACAAPF